MTRPWSIQMGSRPFLSLADVAGHTQFRPDRACGASAPTQSMKLSEVKRKSNQRKKELVPSGSIPLFICPTNYVIELMWYVGTSIVVSSLTQSRSRRQNTRYFYIRIFLNLLI